jgi:DNA-binding transcriptional ArsR family regulator
VLPLTPIDQAACDPAKPTLVERPLLSPDQAAELMGLFKILASDNRLRLLHALVRAGELCVSDLAATVAMTPQAVSNQLQRLIDRRIVAARRQGSNIYYRLVDPCVPGLLDLGLCLAEDAGQLPQPDPAPAQAGVER